MKLNTLPSPWDIRIQKAIGMNMIWCNKIPNAIKFCYIYLGRQNFYHANNQPQWFAGDGDGDGEVIVMWCDVMGCDVMWH